MPFHVGRTQHLLRNSPHQGVSLSQKHEHSFRIYKSDTQVDQSYSQPEECLLGGDGDLGGAYIVRLPCGDSNDYLRCVCGPRLESLTLKPEPWAAPDRAPALRRLQIVSAESNAFHGTPCTSWLAAGMLSGCAC
jgi:hypothetical protein